MRAVLLAEILILLFIHPAARGAEDAGPLARSTQLLIVTAPSFESRAATLQRYERARPGAPFLPLGRPIQVVLGRSGLGWRSDEGAPPPLIPGPTKREGDGRAPAGIMEIGEMWGYAPAPPQGTRLPYRQAGPRDRCVDDPDSPAYAKVLKEPAAPRRPPWRSAEQMRRSDDLYRLLIIVGYNMKRPVRGAGSCIFLHLWQGPGAATAGCTAMAEESLRTIAAWLDPRRRPLLVQLPSAAYPAARRAWGLPGPPITH